jgi:hypothetical protein
MFLAKTYTSAKTLHEVEETYLAEFNTHLIIRVDTPNSTLNVNLVLVHGDQSTKGSRVKFLEHDTVGWLVAFKDLGLDKGGVGCCGSEFFSDLLLGLSECEGPERQYQLLIGWGKAYSGWAKKLERRISWCFPPEMGLRVWTGARKSLNVSFHYIYTVGTYHGISLVPWWISW